MKYSILLMLTKSSQENNHQQLVIHKSTCMSFGIHEEQKSDVLIIALDVKDRKPTKETDK